MNPEISNITFSGKYGSNPLSNGKFIGCNSGGTSGWISLNFATPQSFYQVKITAHAVPTSIETFTLFDGNGNKIGEHTQSVIEGMPNAILIPGTEGTYSTLKIQVASNSSWVAINEILLDKN